MERALRHRPGRRGAASRAASRLLLSGLVLAPGPAPAAVQNGQAAAGGEQVGEAHCREAHRFLSETMRMAVRTEPDTIDDWRTGVTVAGCRVTAAGLTRETPRTAAALLFEAIRGAGWTRTPDPHDAPAEASLRFRRAGSDCVFNFYTGGLLGTDAELAVDRERVPGPGERRYNVLALCMPAT